MALVSRPWGVTPAEVASRVQSMKLTADSQPSTADVAAMIAEHAAWVSARLGRVGVGPELDDESETYQIARGCVIRLVIAEVDTLRGRENTAMSDVRASAEATLEAIDVGPQGLGDGAAASRSHRLTTSAQLADRIDQYTNTKGPLGTRLANRGEL